MIFWELLISCVLHVANSQCLICQKTNVSRRLASTEGASIGAKEGGMWGGGIPLPSRLEGLGECHELPSGVRGRTLAADTFLAYFRVTERL